MQHKRELQKNRLKERKNEFDDKVKWIKIPRITLLSHSCKEQYHRR